MSDVMNTDSSDYKILYAVIVDLEDEEFVIAYDSREAFWADLPKLANKPEYDIDKEDWKKLCEDESLVKLRQFCDKHHATSGLFPSFKIYSGNVVMRDWRPSKKEHASKEDTDESQKE